MITTIGYEGAKIEHFIGTLKAAGVEVLVDIRERAQSRRKGFSKTALSEALSNVGIAYKHFRSLGDPKEGREAARAGDWETFQRVYNAVIVGEPAQTALDEIVEMGKQSEICLLCYERDFTTCHRKIVSDILESRLMSRTRHLGVQTIEPSTSPNGRVLHPRQSAAA